MPQASAITFLHAPPISQPMTSELVYGRKYPVAQALLDFQRTRRIGARDHRGGRLPARRSPVPDSGPRARRRGAGRLRSPGTMTWLIRMSVPLSIPLARLSRVASDPMSSRHASRLARSDCDGTASTDEVGAVERLPMIGRRPHRRRQARRRADSRGSRARSPMACATSARRAHIVTSVPASASTFANAVPHDPAPRTAALVTNPPLSPHSFRRRGSRVRVTARVLPSVSPRWTRRHRDPPSSATGWHNHAHARGARSRPGQGPRPGQVETGACPRTGRARRPRARDAAGHSRRSPRTPTTPWSP